MELNNRTKETIYWYTDYDLDVLIDTYPRRHPGFSVEFPAMLLNEDTPGPDTNVETEALNPNYIAAADVTYSGITRAPGMCDGSDSPNPIFTPIYWTPETPNNEEPDDEN